MGSSLSVIDIMPSLSLPASTIDLSIGPLVIHIYGRAHPEIDCPFDYDWLLANASLNGIPPTEHHRSRSIEAEDLLRFRNALEQLAHGASSAVLRPCEEPFGIEVICTKGDKFRVILIGEAELTAEISASLHDIHEWIEGFSGILRVYPPRSELQGQSA